MTVKKGRTLWFALLLSGICLLITVPIQVRLYLHRAVKDFYAVAFHVDRFVGVVYK